MILPLPTRWLLILASIMVAEYLGDTSWFVYSGLHPSDEPQ